jgi:hypothetical protein
VGGVLLRSALLAKGGTPKKRLSPHLHKVPTWGNKVSPQTMQTALVFYNNNKKKTLKKISILKFLSPFKISETQKALTHQYSYY